MSYDSLYAVSVSRGAGMNGGNNRGQAYAATFLSRDSVHQLFDPVGGALDGFAKLLTRT